MTNLYTDSLPAAAADLAYTAELRADLAKANRLVESAIAHHANLLRWGRFLDAQIADAASTIEQCRFVARLAKAELADWLAA